MVFFQWKISGIYDYIQKFTQNTAERDKEIFSSLWKAVEDMEDREGLTQSNRCQERVKEIEENHQYLEKYYKNFTDMKKGRII